MWDWDDECCDYHGKQDAQESWHFGRLYGDEGISHVNIGRKVFHIER